ncbi:hypothetical protein B296_00021701 [Ensete ventricosum]|uniref:Uncharacterized protein n=1 Tax=Ensete ventricosum TaxID=4639 RepID=A0A426ZAQ2_ENSVE|nr:hypothetical protein B296_00021701 [Ensete ventricosum]
METYSLWLLLASVEGAKGPLFPSHCWRREEEDAAAVEVWPAGVATAAIEEEKGSDDKKHGRGVEGGPLTAIAEGWPAVGEVDNEQTGDSGAVGKVGCGHEGSKVRMRLRLRLGRWWPKERAVVVADEGCGPQCCGLFFGGVETIQRGICTEEQKRSSCCYDGSSSERTMSRWQATLRPIVSPTPTMATAGVGEVEREGCQISNVDANYRAGPESSDPRMRTMLCFCREIEIAALQKRSRPTATASHKGN